MLGGRDFLAQRQGGRDDGAGRSRIEVQRQRRGSITRLDQTVEIEILRLDRDVLGLDDLSGRVGLRVFVVGDDGVGQFADAAVHGGIPESGDRLIDQVSRGVSGHRRDVLVNDNIVAGLDVLNCDVSVGRDRNVARGRDRQRRLDGVDVAADEDIGRQQRCVCCCILRPLLIGRRARRAGISAGDVDDRQGLRRSADDLREIRGGIILQRIRIVGRLELIVSADVDGVRGVEAVVGRLHSAVEVGAAGKLRDRNPLDIQRRGRGIGDVDLNVARRIEDTGATHVISEEFDLTRLRGERGNIDSQLDLLGLDEDLAGECAIGVVVVDKLSQAFGGELAFQPRDFGLVECDLRIDGRVV